MSIKKSLFLLIISLVLSNCKNQEEIVTLSQDLINDYLGTTSVNAHKENWNYDEGVFWDTTYQAEIVITKDGEDVSIKESSSYTNTRLIFEGYNEATMKLTYSSPASSEDHFLSISTDTDSILFTVASGGLGSGSRWSFKGKK